MLMFTRTIPQIILAFVVDDVGLLGFFLKHLNLIIEDFVYSQEHSWFGQGGVQAGTVVGNLPGVSHNPTQMRSGG